MAYDKKARGNYKLGQWKRETEGEHIGPHQRQAARKKNQATKHFLRKSARIAGKVELQQALEEYEEM